MKKLSYHNQPSRQLAPPEAFKEAAKIKYGEEEDMSVYKGRLMGGPIVALLPLLLAGSRPLFQHKMPRLPFKTSQQGAGAINILDLI